MPASNASRLAAEVAALKRAVADLQRTTRLGHSSIEGGSTDVHDITGALRTRIGEQADGTYTVVDSNAPAPQVPQQPTADGRPGLLVVTSYGTTADGSEWPLDLHHLAVHVSTTSPVAADLTTKVGEFGPDGGVLSVALDPGTYYVALVAVNTSGATSAPSAEASANVLAPATGSGGIQTFSSPTEPVGLGPSDEGAIWYDESNGNRPNRWDGTAWQRLDLGGAAIADAAIEERHVGKDQVNPQSMQVAMLGGAFSNLVHDPDFADEFFKSKRLADADPGGRWEFVCNDNLFANPEFQNPYGHIFGTTSGWSAGDPTVTLADDYGTYLSIEVNTLGTVTDGTDLMVGEGDAVPGSIETGRGYSVVAQRPTEAYNVASGGTFEITAQWYDSAKTLLGAPVSSGNEPPLLYSIVDIPVILNLPLAPAGATGVRIIYRYHGPDFTNTDPEGDWLYIACGSSASYNFRLHRYGGEADAGEFMVESYRLASESPQKQVMPLATFPADRDTVYAATYRQQSENFTSPGTFGAPFGEFEIRFYDANGDLIYNVETSQQGWRNSYHPDWSIKSSLFKTPANAVTAQAALVSESSTYEGWVRFRMPQISVAGWFDRGTGHRAHISPAGIAFEHDFPGTGGGKRLFAFTPDYETDGGTFRVDAFTEFKDQVVISYPYAGDGLYVDAPISRFTQDLDVEGTVRWGDPSTYHVQADYDRLQSYDGSTPGGPLRLNPGGGAVTINGVNVVDRLTALESKPMCRGELRTQQSLPPGFTTITGYTEVYDEGSILDPVTGLVTIPEDGVYFIGCGITVGQSSVGRRFMDIQNNATSEVLFRVEGTPNDGGWFSPAGGSDVLLTAGTVLVFKVYQNSGATLDARGDFSPTWFTVRKV